MALKTGLPRWLAYSIVAILVSASLSLVVLYQIRESTKNEIRHSLFEKAKAEQIITTRTIAGKIASDLDSMMSRLGQLAAFQKLQDGLFAESATAALLDEKFRELQSLYSVDSIFIIDDNNILVGASGNSNFTRLLGLDFSQRNYVSELAQTRAPVFSNWYLGADGNSKVTVIYPIINRDTGKMVGAVGASVIAKPFFSMYGNIYDFNSSQYINILDRKAVFAASPNPAVIGLSFYDEKIQNEFVKRNAVLNKFYADVLSGKASSAVFDVGFGERLATGQPIIVNGKPVYFLAVGIPTNLIYSDIDALLASQNLLNYVQWIALLAAIGLILLFLVRLNVHLDREVSARTRELAAANIRLTEANEQLKTNDRMQKEFINIAAHELRTPITPILVALHLKNQVKGIDGTSQTVLAESQAEMIERNAKRLERLANDILTVTRIEGKGMDLCKEAIDMNENMAHVISDARTLVPSNKNIDFVLEPSGEPLTVQADRSKLFEVLSNLTRNAIRFSDNEGKITITLKKSEDGRDAVVQVRDGGRGIEPEIMPRLFQKFASAASSHTLGGTGLGLYISKSIIEAHGGRIWAENNRDGKGATFTFTLPLKP